MPLEEVNTLDDFTYTLKNNKYVFVDYYASWCGPCKAITPLITTLSNDSQLAGIKFIKINVDECNFETTVTSLPTFQLFENGRKVKECVGANKTDIIGMFKDVEFENI